MRVSRWKPGRAFVALMTAAQVAALAGPATARKAVVAATDGRGSPTACDAATPTPCTAIAGTVAAAKPGDLTKVCPGIYQA